jgi:hypothetical protein
MSEVFSLIKIWRLAYGYFATSVSRQFVLVGTTNQELILHDATGNRRYLPVRVRGIDIEALKRDREQLLAEAIELAKTYGPLVMPAGLRQRSFGVKRNSPSSIMGFNG